MKKELCAAATLCLLLIGSFANYIHLKELNTQITRHIDESIRHCALEDYSSAYTEAVKALQIRENAKGYTQVFLRHNELDALSDLYCDALGAIQNREKYDAEYLLTKIHHHTANLVSMERISFGSVF